jgi:hypothetical protein
MMLAGLKHQFSNTFSAGGAVYLGPQHGYGLRAVLRRSLSLQHQVLLRAVGLRHQFIFKLFGIWQPVIFRGSNNWAEKVAGGWSLSGIATFHTGYGWTPVLTAPHQIYCNSATTDIRICARVTSVELIPPSVETPSRQPQSFPTRALPNTGTNNNLFLNNYFEVPDYSNAITDNPGQATNNYIPPPGLDRNSFPGPGYRDVDLNIAKAFGLPNMKIIGENAKIEIKANMLNAFNLLNINPSTLSTNITNSNLGQASGALGSRTIDFQARFSF